MEYRRRRYFHFQHIPQVTHSKYYRFGAHYNGHEIGKLPLRTFSTFLLEHVNILLPPCRTSIRPRHAVRGPLSHARTLEGRIHRAVSVGHRGRHERPHQALTQVCESPDGQRWLMVYGASPWSWKRNFVVPCSQYLAITIFASSLLNATWCDRTKAFPTSHLIF
jgi:hypothetical protein